MSVAHKLGKDEAEIADWPLSRLVRWMAYFKIVREEENKAYKKAQAEAARNRNQGGKRLGLSY